MTVDLYLLMAIVIAVVTVMLIIFVVIGWQIKRINIIVDSRTAEFIIVSKSAAAAQATLDEKAAEAIRRGLAAQATTHATTGITHDAAKAAADVLETARVAAATRALDKSSAAADVLLTASMAHATKATQDRITDERRERLRRETDVKAAEIMKAVEDPSTPKE